MPMPEVVNGRRVRTGSWEPSEDAGLAEWQAKLGNRWAAVAKHIPGRTGQQCAQRWRHRVNPDIRKDKWTEEEDQRLMELVRFHGSCWAEISRGMNGRTDQQCMGRWRRHLDPGINRSPWLPAEDAALERLFARHGSQWSKIARSFNGRTAQQCRARWFQVEAAGGAADDGSDREGAGLEEARPVSARPRSGGGRRKARPRQPEPDSEEEEEEEAEEEDQEEACVATLQERLSQDNGVSRGGGSSRSTATAAALREARRMSLVTTATTRPEPRGTPGASSVPEEVDGSHFGRDAMADGSDGDGGEDGGAWRLRLATVGTAPAGQDECRTPERDGAAAGAGAATMASAARRGAGGAPPADARTGSAKKRLPPIPLFHDGADPTPNAPNSAEKCLISPTRDCLTATTLFATPQRGPPAARQGDTPAATGPPTEYQLAGGALTTPSSGGKWRLSPSSNIMSLLASPGNDADEVGMRSPTAFLEFASPDKSRSGAQRSSRSRLGLAVANPALQGGTPARLPVARRLEMSNSGAAAAGGGEISFGSPPKRPKTDGGLSPGAAAAKSPAASAAAAASPMLVLPPPQQAPPQQLAPQQRAPEQQAPQQRAAQERERSRHSAAAGPWPSEFAAASAPPKPAQVVQQYALVPPELFATLKPGPQTLDNLMRIMNTLPPSRPATGGGADMAIGAASAAAPPLSIAAGGDGSAAARMRLNALLDFA